jgi:hypothetical protein
MDSVCRVSNPIVRRAVFTHTSPTIQSHHFDCLQLNFLIRCLHATSTTGFSDSSIFDRAVLQAHSPTEAGSEGSRCESCDDGLEA